MFEVMKRICIILMMVVLGIASSFSQTLENGKLKSTSKYISLSESISVEEYKDVIKAKLFELDGVSVLETNNKLVVKYKTLYKTADASSTVTVEFDGSSAKISSYTSSIHIPRTVVNGIVYPERNIQPYKLFNKKGYIKAMWRKSVSECHKENLEMVRLIENELITVQ